MLMLFQIERDSFFNGLSKTVPITEKRSPLPILSHVLINAENNKLILTATDLEVGLQINYDCEVKEPGMVTVPSKMIYEIVREMPSGVMTVEQADGYRIKIVSGQSVFELAGMDPSDYPAWSALEEVQTAVVEAEKLLHMVDKTMFASSSDESRFNLNGILFEQNKDKTRMVATDGHRLALIDEPLGISLDSKMLVPKKGVLEMRRVLEGLKGEIKVGFEKKNMVIRTNRFSMTIRLIEGDYPDYRKVIPPASDMIAKANRLGLIQILRRVAILTSDRNKGVTMKVGSGQMELKAVHPDLGTARDVVDLDFEGEEFTIIVNVAYMIEALGVLDTELVQFEFHDEEEPIIVRPDQAEDYFNLVMPMRK
jgi:DNA polymerase-3 subunit beta